MRILSVTAQKPGSTGSGVYLTELVKGFQKLGHQQAVIAGITKEDCVQLQEEVEFYPVYYKTSSLPFAVCGMSDEMPYESTRYCDMTEEMTACFTNAFRERVKEVVELFQPDVILCHHLYYLTALVRNLYPNIKVYGISHGSDLRQINKNPWQREFIKNNVCKLDQIFALHKEQKSMICDTHGCLSNIVNVIGTGYNSEVFHVVEGLEKSTEKIKYIFVGKLSEKKGVMSYLRAISYIPNAKEDMELIFVGGYGNESEYQEIKRLAEECPCDVKILGRLSSEELVKKMNESHVLVLPSFFEGLPLVVIEAMACGLKVVCTDLPGIQNWLNENIPDHGVVFVEPPKMQNSDEPIPEFLVEFEKRLAKALIDVRDQQVPKQENVKKISWDGLCKKLDTYMK